MIMKTILFAATTALVATACGDDKKQPDAPVSIDSPPIDARNAPPQPHLGTQIDRMGRPAINTALNHAFDTNATTRTAAKDTYNADPSPSNWPTMYTPDFAKSLAVLDSLDKGLLPTTTTTGNACGNQVLYNNMPGGQVGTPVKCFNAGTYQATCSYNTLAGLLADDQLYLDTTKTRCKAYLAVEFKAISPANPQQDCGGRAPDNDVMDTSYSVLAAGILGFDLTADPPTPKFGDTVPAHTDYATDFPFFGAPH
jgi:hypothetical protein